MWLVVVAVILYLVMVVVMCDVTDGRRVRRDGGCQKQWQDNEGYSVVIMEER